MQKYLHDQPGAQKSFDVVAQTSALFEVIVRHIQPAIAGVAVKGTIRERDVCYVFVFLNVAVGEEEVNVVIAGNGPLLSCVCVCGRCSHCSCGGVDGVHSGPLYREPDVPC